MVEKSIVISSKGNPNIPPPPMVYASPASIDRARFVI
jgi:hypothetical protein